MTEIDRRLLLAGAGTTLAVSACKADDIGTARSAIKIDEYLNPEKSGYSIMGTSPEHETVGIPTVQGRRKPKGYNGNFNPANVCLVYIKIDQGLIKTSHAYFAASGLNIGDTFQSYIDSNPRSWPNPKRFENNFEEFTFGSQCRIFFYIDNGSNIKFDPINTIQMTHFGPRDTRKPKIKKSENNCFLNPEIDTTTWPGKQLLKLENWYTNERGELIPMYGENISVSDQRQYSFNIHMLMRCSLGTANSANPIKYTDVPFVIDPDTGNMGSSP